MKESDWTRRVCDELKKMNALVFAIVASKMQESGWPDRYLHHTRWQGWLEFKGRTTVVKTKQRIIIRELNRRKPGSAYVVRYPGLVEDHEGNCLATFDGSGRDLLEALELLWNTI